MSCATLLMAAYSPVVPGVVSAARIRMSASRIAWYTSSDTAIHSDSDRMCPTFRPSWRRGSCMGTTRSRRSMTAMAAKAAANIAAFTAVTATTPPPPSSTRADSAMRRIGWP